MLNTCSPQSASWISRDGDHREISPVSVVDIMTSVFKSRRKPVMTHTVKQKIREIKVIMHQRWEATTNVDDLTFWIWLTSLVLRRWGQVWQPWCHRMFLIRIRNCSCRKAMASTPAAAAPFVPSLLIFYKFIQCKNWIITNSATDVTENELLKWVWLLFFFVKAI